VRYAGDIMSHMPDRYAYLGPEGTFTEAALATLAEAVEIEPAPYPTVQATLEAVRNGQAARAVVPIENSQAGSINETYDLLDEGAASIVGGHWIHEFAHDGRHLLGFPCH